MINAPPLRPMATTSATAQSSCSAVCPRRASTLSQLLLDEGPEKLRASLRVAGIRVWHVCFDAILARLEADAGAEGFRPELWHAAREKALQATREHFLTGSAATLEAVARVTSSGTAPWMDLVVIDDNMHYRSMRRAFYRVAREARLALCNVCLPLAVDAAVERDAAREPPQRVGRATIELMAETLQWPEPDKHPWETCSITCDASEAAGRAAPVDSGFWAQLSHALARPVAAEATTGAEAEARASLSAADAAQTAENVVHQLDNRLRRLVSGHMKSAEVVALPPAQVSAIAKSLSDRKREALAACKRQLKEAASRPRVARG